MTSTLTVEAHERGAYRVFARRTMSRNKKAFFIVPHRGGHRARDREDDLRTMYFFVRKVGTRDMEEYNKRLEPCQLEEVIALILKCPVIPSFLSYPHSVLPSVQFNSEGGVEGKDR